MYELKKVKIKWPQLVGDRLRHRKHTMAHKTITLIGSAFLNNFLLFNQKKSSRFLSSL
jgi:hypothetical protein